MKPTAHLHPTFFDQPTLGSIRDGFGAGLVALAKSNLAVVGLCADVTESVRMQPFAEAFPERFVEVGVAEQNVLGVAAGLALAGKIPVAASYAVFSPGRSWDQLRVSICYSNLNVKVIGGHAGLNVGPDGATHQALEDLALTQVLPNLTVVVPADETEAAAAMQAIGNHVGPCYLRLIRDKSPLVINETSPFVLGKARQLTTGRDVSIFACGLMVHMAVSAAKMLEEQGIDAEVINIHTLKPLDQAAIVASATKTRAVVVAEEHQLFGGLTSAVSMTLVQHVPTPLEAVAVRDTFGESGTSEELLTKYHLTTNDIAKAVWRVLERKNSTKKS